MGIGIKNLLLNLIYPPRCVFCGKRLSPKSVLPVCSECSNSLPYCRTYTRCKHCGKPIPESSNGMCRKCRLSRQYNTRITSAFVYIDKARNAVIALKKEANSGYAKVLSYYVAGMVNYDFGGVDFDAVVSVPPRKKGLTDEKFDQAGRLAKEVSIRLALPYISNAMLQTKRIRKQSSLKYDARAKNVKGAFAVRKPAAVKGKTILLIDDVATSCSTLEECAKMLKEAGAFRVYSATIATTPIV